MARGLMTALLCSINTLNIWLMLVMSTIRAPNQLRHADQISYGFRLSKITFAKFKCTLNRPTEGTYWCWTIFKHKLTHVLSVDPWAILTKFELKQYRLHIRFTPFSEKVWTCWWTHAALCWLPFFYKKSKTHAAFGRITKWNDETNINHLNT